MCNVRPELVYRMGVLAKLTADPKKSHWHGCVLLRHQKGVQLDTISNLAKGWIWLDIVTPTGLGIQRIEAWINTRENFALSTSCRKVLQCFFPSMYASYFLSSYCHNSSASAPLGVTKRSLQMISKFIVIHHSLRIMHGYISAPARHLTLPLSQWLTDFRYVLSLW